MCQPTMCIPSVQTHHLQLVSTCIWSRRSFIVLPFCSCFISISVVSPVDSFSSLSLFLHFQQDPAPFISDAVDLCVDYRPQVMLKSLSLSNYLWQSFLSHALQFGSSSLPRTIITFITLLHYFSLWMGLEPQANHLRNLQTVPEPIRRRRRPPDAQ